MTQAGTDSVLRVWFDRRRSDSALVDYVADLAPAHVGEGTSERSEIIEYVVHRIPDEERGLGRGRGAPVLPGHKPERVFDPFFDSLYYLVERLSLIDQFVSTIDYVNTYRVNIMNREAPPSMRSPIVLRARQDSPLLVELVGSGSLTAAAAYLFKRPDKIGSFFPDIVTGFYDGIARAKEAKKQAALLYKAGANMDTRKLDDEDEPSPET